MKKYFFYGSYATVLFMLCLSLASASRSMEDELRDDAEKMVKNMQGISKGRFFVHEDIGIKPLGLMMVHIVKKAPAPLHSMEVISQKYLDLGLPKDETLEAKQWMRKIARFECRNNRIISLGALERG